MSADAPIKALLCAMVEDTAAATATITRLKPDLLCLFGPAASAPLFEQQVQPQVAQMPRRWDWVVTPDPRDFMASYRAVGTTVPALLETWEVGLGELVLSLGDATPAMAGAMLLAGLGKTSRVTQWLDAPSGAEGESEPIDIGGRARRWAQGNPWDEAATGLRQEACGYFNRGWYQAAAALFRVIEARVSGSQKPLYHACSDLSEGYGFWQRGQYRPAWEKLKTSAKSLEMASLWGGPPGLKPLIPALKANAGFLEKIVLDPHDVKEHMALDLLANARRCLDQLHDPETAMITVRRALEARAQVALYKHHKVKSWDVQPEQLPDALREVCRTCYQDDVDGKFKLPLQSQFRALAGLGDPLGQSFLRDWPKFKPLLDAANHAVLGHGFEPVKSERVQQLYDLVLRLTDTPETSLPKFPVLNL